MMDSTDNGDSVEPVAPKQMSKEDSDIKHQEDLSSKSKSGAEDPNVHQIITINFHVVLSTKKFNFKSSGHDKVIMRFDSDELGGWSCLNHVMAKNYVDEKYALMTYSVAMDKSFLTDARSPVQYKYAIHRGDDSQVEYEFLVKKKAHSGSLVNRELKIPLEHLNSLDEWHQYDDRIFIESYRPSILMAPVSNVLNWFDNENNRRFKKDMSVMLPSWDDIKGSEKFSGRCFLEKLDQVCFCAMNSFENLTCDGSNLKEVLEEYVLTAMLRLQVDIARRHHETEVQAGVRLASACCVVYIMETYQPKLSLKITTPTFWALLLKAEKDSLICYDYQQLIDIHFPTEVWRNKIGNCLLKFLKCMANEDFFEPLWLFAIPLLHFLCGYSKPKASLQIPHPMANRINRNPEFWGIKNVQSLVNESKKKDICSKKLQNYLDCLGPLFEVDMLLPRTMLALMNLSKDVLYLYKTPGFPVDACLANCIFFACTEKDIEKLKPALQVLEELTRSGRSKLSPSDLKTQDEKVYQLLFQRDLAIEVLNEICSKATHLNSHTLQIATQIAANCISSIQQLASFAEDSDDNRIAKLSEEAKAAMDALVHKFEFCLSTNCSEFLVTPESTKNLVNANTTFPTNAMDELQIYGLLLQVQFFDDATKAIWKTSIEVHLTERLKRLSPELQIRVFCDSDKYPAELGTFFKKAAFDVLENAKNAAFCDCSYLFELVDKGESITKFEDFLLQLFLKSWPMKPDGQPFNDETEILKYILSWPSYIGFLKLFYVHSKKVKLLKENCFQHIQITISVFKNVLAKLLKGDITFSHLELLLDNKMHTSCLELYKFLEKNSDEKVNVPDSGVDGIDKCGVLEKVISWRAIEKKSFQDACKPLHHFLELSHGVQSDDLSNLQDLLKWDRDKLLIEDVCKPKTYIPEDALQQNYTPELIYFQLPAKADEMVNYLWKQKDSIIVHNIWRDCLKHLTEEQVPCSLDQVTDVWNTFMESWTEFRRQMTSGEITLKSVDLKFSSFKDKYDAMETELNFAAEADIAHERRKQIEYYHQMCWHSRGAEIMLQLQEKFELKGDFSVPKALLNLVTDKDMALGAITEQLVNTRKELEELTVTKLECLDVFVKHKNFADWLRKFVNGAKEVKVLVDLAMISAEGQGDMEVQKISCLYAAAIGYAPLIYDLTSDMGFQEVFALCKTVWHVLDVDNMLPRKFEDTALQVDWLNHVKEYQGSVEVNVLADAQAINAKGIYKVGNIGKSKMTLNDVVELSLKLEKGDRYIEAESFVNEEIEKSKWQTLSLYQLNDLQNKLMLVAGKAQERKEDINSFVEILDGITSLGGLYVQICNAGCSLFHHWKAIFYCDRERPKYAEVEFGKDGKHIFCGPKMAARNGVLGYIRDLRTFMEGCLKEWLEHIAEQRTELYYLNYYTTEQLIILQTELPKITRNETQISKDIFPLLALVKKNCSRQNIKDAMNLTIKGIEETEKKASEEAEEKKNAELQENMRQFLETLKTAGYSRELAMRALKECGANIREGLMWCMKNNDSDDEDDAKEGKHRNKIQFTTLQLETTTEALTANLFQAQTLGNELESLRELWRMYQKQMNTSLADYLSIKHLGCMLDHLAVMGEDKIGRLLPAYMNKGKPNLILCSQVEIYAVVLSIYMNESGKGNCLPGIDEVLVCNSSTTAEDVTLLWRRAEGDARSRHQGKIYCLVHAELLNYETARRSELSLDKHSHAAEELQVVVVCCREQENRSHMINALNRYLIKVPPLERDVVQAYIKQHLTISDQTAARSAAELDPERCSVRVIKSHRAGVGKSLKVHRLHEQRQSWKLPNQDYDGSLLISILLHHKTVDPSVVLNRLLQCSLEPETVVPRIFHINIAREVQEGVDYLLFNLLILGSITDRDGYVWSRSPTDLYLIETMPLMQREAKSPEKQQKKPHCVHNIFHLLPTVTCWSPTDSLEILKGSTSTIKDKYADAVVSSHDQKMDDKEFRSAMFQRPFKYLARFAKNQKLHGIQVAVPEGGYVECIQCLLAHCGIRDPSWSELRHFVNFLDVQLQSCEKSVYCGELLAPDLPGFLNFVIKFMMQMSQDFATRSLTISEETPEVARQLFNQDNLQPNDILGQYELKRRWETSPHPYLFFNADQISFTFMGFFIDKRTGDIVEPGKQNVLIQKVLPKELYSALIRNGVNLSENFDQLQRLEKIKKMTHIIGIEYHDPDCTYELTADNVKKMLAIYMRFRCDIPVIIMGETGCGKTRLIKFLCDLWKPPGSNLTNMIIMKVHGGTTAVDIERKVTEALHHAKLNSKKHPGILTVLFFDEANTTEGIGMIKEIMCDHTIGGKPLPSTYGLKLIAACNPYRKHSDEMIQRMEHAGLGYHIQAHQTTDKLGHIPMRHLVYRVQALPQSMLPLVWDFGRLNNEVEMLYIQQMVHRHVNLDPSLRGIPQLKETVSTILAKSQEFMRKQKDECSFVSLRDVDRALLVMMWFYPREKELFLKITEKAKARMLEDDEKKVEEEEKPELESGIPTNLTRSLILALGVCYHACLEKRKEFREFIAKHFVAPCQIENGAKTIEENIKWCQEVFLDAVELEDNIARNEALKENLFMMVICIELRIPLFLVGKPGSSKSLAKTIVADAMQGEAARSELFKTLKSIHMVSYQCSPLSTPEGIVGTFRQCAKLQEGQDLNKFVSVVVLDEVGLAEDSSRMPLKTLHPLLEDGCEDDKIPALCRKVGFIGISNWALDPAKMNRGILVQRGVPDEQELEQSAKGICAKDQIIACRIEGFVQPMAKAYLELYNSALKIREYFGLRDFYSLIKMIYGFTKRSDKLPTWAELKHAILRNFSGLDDIHPLEVFERHLQNVDKDQPLKETDPASDIASLIHCSLTGGDVDSTSRYLLLLTENYAALGLLQHELLEIKDTIIIFGSSFPKDQQYTQICRNINRIKVCMETGRTVVLLNLENLYESLYDALNQYYVRFGDQRFVDLGLGTQRVKCRVHQLFRLIVVAEKQVVYEKFPIPLINRLEKHFLAMNSILTQDQVEIAERLCHWAKDFSSIGFQQCSKNQPKPGDVFIGYHPDTAASLVLQVCHSKSKGTELVEDKGGQILEEAKYLLLCCAVPEAIIRLSNTRLVASADKIYKKYFEEQSHSNLADFLRRIVVDKSPAKRLFAQITTHSRLLLSCDAQQIAKALNLGKIDVILEALHAFGTEQQFCQMLKNFFTKSCDRILLLQCDSGDLNADLIACARYNIWNEYLQYSVPDSSKHESLMHLIFIVQLPRIAGGCFVGFQGDQWMSYHIDDLHLKDDGIPPLFALKGHSLGTLFEAAVEIETECIKTVKEATLNVGSIIMTCLHGATAMLKDAAKEEFMKLRKTERLQILMKHLSKPDVKGELTLMYVIKRRLSLLLKNKEETTMAVTKANGWLSNEAASFEAICQAGTFRRSLWQHLETKVTPLLAGIIAFLDVNANLDLLENHHDQSLVTMWMNILNNTDIFVLKYKDLQTATQRMELTEFEVKTTGAHGTFFRAQLPFSWLIKEQTDCLIYTAKQDASKDTRFLAEAALHVSPLGKVLEQAAAEGGMETLIHRYLVDFVHMVHRSQSAHPDIECDLVVRDMYYAVKCRYLQEQKQKKDNIDDQSLCMHTSIPHIHLVYESIRKRLVLFSELVQIWPEIVERLAETKRNMPLDLQSFLLLLKVYLVPTVNNLLNVVTRKEWVDKVRLLTPIIQRLHESVSDVTSENVEDRDSCRFMWNRIGAVKLFIEHVCPSDEADLIHSIKWCWTFWEMLADRTDFKTDASFETVENFFNTCNTKACELFFGKLGACPHCGKTVEYPIKLPCKHLICGQCLIELKEIKHLKCPKPECLQSFPADLEAELITKRKDSREKFARYKQQCNAFFMEVVSHFCFADNTPPDVEVIHKLMGYVTHKSNHLEYVGGNGNAVTVQKTKKMFGDGLDPTPVVRSFLLQLLLQANIESVRDCLEKYFQNAHGLVETDPAQVVELCILCVQSLEDYYHRQSMQCDSDMNQIDFTDYLLRKSTKLIHENISDIEMDTLESIARVRYGLTEAASWMHRVYVTADDNRTLLTKIYSLFEASKHICDQDQLQWPRIYLMRQLARRFGLDALKQVSEIKDLSWINPKEAVENQNQNDANPDRFIIYGDSYIQVREALAKGLLNKDFEPFKETLETLKDPSDVAECIALLAIYHEVTAAKIREDDQHEKIVQQLENFCTASPIFVEKGLTLDIVNNRLRGCLQVRPSQSGKERSIAEVILHFKLLLMHCQKNGSQKLFIDMMTAPQNMKNSFLPTMPQNEMDDIRDAIRVASNENSTFYECPNGHPYVIGNCGRAMEESKCRVCNAIIGGTYHTLLQSNKPVAENTTKGHILGQPQKRAPDRVRQMSPASTAVLRVLLHMSMYLGSLENPQGFNQLIIPQVKPESVSQFLLDHVGFDIDTIHSAVGLSEDDVFVFMHILVNSMFHNIKPAADIGLQLENSHSRLKWENAYVNAYIVPTLNGLNTKIQEANNKLINDNRLGNTRSLLRTVFEVDIPTTTTDIGKIQEEPSLWRFRSRISVEHLTHAFEESLTEKKENSSNDNTVQQIYPILQLFLKDDHQMRAIRLLPSILRLHRLLLQRLNRCLDRSEATMMKIGEFLETIKEENQRQELQNLINDFALAWDCVRLSLPNFYCEGNVIPLEYAQEPVKMESRLAMLLPSFVGWGLCSVALVYYLKDLQNNFLENYSKETKQSLSRQVDIYDASFPHLVAYHPVNDLQPIILANCNYSLEVGKGTTIEYDFGSMEKQITERFIHGRPRLEIAQMEQIHFQEDVTNAAILRQLHSRITQVSLPSQVDLESYLKNKLADVTDLLASLNIAVGFLVTTGGDPDMSIYNFMVDMLNMKQTDITALLLPYKLKHVESLWIMLSYLRARIQAHCNHEAFEKVEEKYRVPIPNDLHQVLLSSFQHIQMDKFLILLYECIIFNITVKQNANSEDYVDNSEYSLKDVLIAYMSDSSVSSYSIPALEDNRFPEGIKAKHCISTWLLGLSSSHRS